jgi:hypothetical protein
MGTLKITSGNTKKLTITPGKPVLTVTGSPFDFIFKDGNEYTTLTGGWNHSIESSYSNTSSFDITNSMNFSIDLNEPGNVIITASTTNTIDLTNYNNIYIEWDTSYTNTYSISSSFKLKIGETASMITKSGQFVQVTDALDISEITGSYYIKVELIGSQGPGASGIIDSNVFSIYLF